MTPARLALPFAGALLLSGCVAQSAGASGTTVTVRSTAEGCALSASSAPAGAVTFRVINEGTSLTEFYLYAADGTSIVAEVEDIGPGVSREVVSTLDSGAYVTACKPGQTGDGIRADFTVTDRAGQGTAAPGASPALVAVDASAIADAPWPASSVRGPQPSWSS